MADTTTKRRIEIAVEKRRFVFLKGRNTALDAWCDACGGQVRMVTPDQAALISNVSSRTIYRWLENGTLHFMETLNGFSLICLASLENRPAQREAQPQNSRASKPKQFFKNGLMRRILKRR